MIYYAYIRVSTTRQGEEGVSLETQRRFIADYATRHRLTIAAWFEDRETAAKQGRPQFTLMVKALRKGKAQGMIIHKIDRSSRNIKDWAEIGDLIDEGIRVEFVHESLDLTSRGGRLTADIQAVIAADYVRNLREEVKKGIYGRLAQGIYPFGAPIGYLNCGAGKPKIHDPIHGPFIRAAFELYATGHYSLVTLAENLTERGFRTRSGGRLHTSHLAKILRNPFYMGELLIFRNGKRFKGIHMPLVSRMMFDRVQTILDGRIVSRTISHRFLFRRLFTCAVCGYSLVGETAKGHVYYRCHQCKRSAVREERIGETVLGRLRRLRLTLPERHYVSARVAMLTQESRRVRDMEQRALTLLLAQCERRLAKALNAYLDEVIDRSAYEAHGAGLREQRECLRRQLAQYEDVHAAEDRPALIELLEDLPAQYALGTDEERRDLLCLVTKTRTVLHKTVAVTLRAPFEAMMG